MERKLNKRRTLEVAILIGLIFSILISITSFDAKCTDIRSSVLRLHVLANSDTAEDQALKLKVRDRLLAESEELFADAATEEDALNSAKKELSALQNAAEDEIAANGYAYPVKVEVGKSYFNTRVYDNFTLPAGEYEAVRVLIGEAEGKNWWCVMFPPVCLPVAGESRELSEVLSDDELDVVENPVEYEFRFKTVEIYETIKEKLSEIFN